MFVTGIMSGAPVAASLNGKTARLTQALGERGIQATVAIVRVGEREDDIAYERGALRRCAQTGVKARQVRLPADCAQGTLLETLTALDQDAGVHGILLFRPLPPHISDEAARRAISTAKDVDGITDASMAGVFTGSAVGYPPCTAQACMEILDHYAVPLKGRRAVVVGSSLVVGRPTAMLLLARNATVTICHKFTQDLAAECLGADVLVACVGKPKVLGAGCLAPGQAVVDVGVNVLPDGGMCGDVDFLAAQGTVALITPVPGGVGAVTTSVLALHAAQAAQKAAGLAP